MENLRPYNFSIHRKFYQNLFLNVCARKKKAKIPQSLIVSRVFLWDLEELTFLIIQLYKNWDNGKEYLGENTPGEGLSDGENYLDDESPMHPLLQEK